MENSDLLKTEQNNQDRRMSIVQGVKMVPLKELEQIKFKLKIVETKRQEDREKLIEFEKLKLDYEQLSHQYEKANQKILENQQDSSFVKEKELERNKEIYVDKKEHLEILDQLESITLDKEMAEEKAEALQQELEFMKSKVEELSMDLELARHEKEEYMIQVAGHDQQASGGSVEVMTLQKQNELLKEALVKLRDLSTQTEVDLNKKLRQMEKENGHLKDIEAMYKEQSKELEQLKETVQILKEQLDDALESQEILDKLTIKNQKLSQQVEEQRTQIEDLETLKELNEELEENHLLTEKELKQQIEDQDLSIQQLKLDLEQHLITIADYERTIEQFRVLVKHLQTDLERMQIKSENLDQKHLESQTREMVNLNLQLQNTVSKASAKTFELEWKRIESEEMALHLSLLQNYLPDLYLKERDYESISSILIVQKVQWKLHIFINYLHSQLKQQLAPEQILPIYLLEKVCLSMSFCFEWIYMSIEYGSVEVFSQFKGSFYEELKNGAEKLSELFMELKDVPVSFSHCERFKRLLSQFESLKEEKFKNSQQLMTQKPALALLKQMQHFSKQTLTQLEQIPYLLQSKAYAKENLSRCDLVELKATVPTFNASIVKCLALLEEKEQEGKLLNTSLFNKLKEYQIETEQLSAWMEAFVEQILKLVNDDSVTFDTKELKTLYNRLRVLKDQIEQFNNQLNMPNAFIVQTLPNEPWKQRANELLMKYKKNSQLEHKIQEMQLEINSLQKEIKSKEEVKEQFQLKNQLLESRIQQLRQRSNIMEDYEKEISLLKEQEVVYQDAIDSLQKQVDQLDEQVLKLQHQLKMKEEQSEKEISYNMSASAGELLTVHQQKTFSLLKYYQKERSKLLYADAHQKLKNLLLDEPLKEKPNEEVLETALLKMQDVLKYCQQASSSFKVISLPSKGQKKKSFLLQQQQLQQRNQMFELQKRFSFLSSSLQQQQQQSFTLERGQTKKIGNIYIEGKEAKHEKVLYLNRKEFKHLHNLFLN